MTNGCSKESNVSDWCGVLPWMDVQTLSGAASQIDPGLGVHSGFLKTARKGVYTKPCRCHSSNQYSVQLQSSSVKP